MLKHVKFPAPVLRIFEAIVAIATADIWKAIALVETAGEKIIKV